MPRIKDLRQHMIDHYEDEELARAVWEDANKHGNLQKITDGVLTLPSPEDARLWHDRKTGRVGVTPEQRANEQRMKALEELLFEMHAQQDKPTPERRAEINHRVEQLKAGDQAK